MKSGERLYEELKCLKEKMPSKVKTAELKRVGKVEHNKTVYRDIHILESIDCVIEGVSGRDGGFTLQSSPTDCEIATMGEGEEFRTMMEIFTTGFLEDKKDEFKPGEVARFREYVLRILMSHQLENPIHRKEKD